MRLAGSFAGVGCAERAECPGGCSAAHGTCVAGKCVCELGWAGADCSKPLGCPADCHGNGVCHNGRCACEPGFVGEDCAFADILISPRFPVCRGCDSPRLVLDADDFKRAGAHAIWLSDVEIIGRNVAAGRGRRPWVGAAR